MSARVAAVLLLALSVACFTAGAGLAAWYYSGKVKTLGFQIDSCISKNEKFQSLTDLQNQSIESLNTYAAQQSEKYNALLLQPEKVRFQIKYREVKTNDCADIKSIIDDIRVSGF